MKWFKHMTDANRDERLALLIAEHGLEAYGFYFLVLEIIGQQMDGTCKTSVTYPEKVWRKFTGLSPKKFKTFTTFCKNLDLFSMETCENGLTIDCAKLLEIRDEHTRKQSKNSGATQEQLRTDSGPEPDQEPEPETTPPTPQGAGGGGDGFLDMKNLKDAFPALARLGDAEILAALAGRNGDTARALVVLAKASEDATVRNPGKVLGYRLKIDNTVSAADLRKARRALGLHDPHIKLTCPLCSKTKILEADQAKLNRFCACGEPWKKEEVTV